MSNNIQQELGKIEIPKDLHKRVQLGVARAKSEKPNRKFKWLSIPLIASAFVVLSAAVGAAHITSFNNLVALVSPEIASMLQPIELSSESNGIKMEVVAAMNDNEMAVIYITLQDLTGNRIDNTIDLYDFSFSGAQMFNSQIVDYDEAANTATLRIQGNGGESLNNRKLNFRVTSILSDKQTFEFSVHANLSETISNPPQTVPLDMKNISGGGGDLYKKLEDQGIIQVLNPDVNEIALPGINFMHISNIGTIGDYFHIQTKWNEDNVDDHGYFYFVDDIGNEIFPSSIYFGTDEKGQTKYGKEYTEYIFDKDTVDLEEQELLAHFVSNGKYTTGNWNTTFLIQPVKEEIDMEMIKNFGTWSSEKVSISPLGVTLLGKGKSKDSMNIDVSTKMTDGHVQLFDSKFVYEDDEDIRVKFVSSQPLEPSEVEAIYVNGTEIVLKEANNGR